MGKKWTVSFKTKHNKHFLKIIMLFSSELHPLANSLIPLLGPTFFSFLAHAFLVYKRVCNLDVN